jgi:hypothetical protein
LREGVQEKPERLGAKSQSSLICGTCFHEHDGEIALMLAV